jgi:hypothetical protein
VGRGVTRLLGASLRIEESVDPAVAALWARRSPVIYAVWHADILMLPYLYGHQRRVHVLASRSRDGELLARFVQGFGIPVVRGSSSRGGGRALLGLARLVRRQRAEVLVVPDGPRGPRGVAKAGAVLLARVTGAPVVPVGVSVRPCRRLRSWDRFVVPLPFARLAIVLGPPLSVEPDADRVRLEAHRRALEVGLARAAEAAARRTGDRDALAL